jgi:hypothetical protein
LLEIFFNLLQNLSKKAEIKRKENNQETNFAFQSSPEFNYMKNCISKTKYGTRKNNIYLARSKIFLFFEKLSVI